MNWLRLFLLRLSRTALVCPQHSIFFQLEWQQNFSREFGKGSRNESMIQLSCSWLIFDVRNAVFGEGYTILCHPNSSFQWRNSPTAFELESTFLRPLVRLPKWRQLYCQWYLIDFPALNRRIRWCWNPRASFWAFSNERIFHSRFVKFPKTDIKCWVKNDFPFESWTLILRIYHLFSFFDYVFLPHSQFPNQCFQALFCLGYIQWNLVFKGELSLIFDHLFGDLTHFDEYFLFIEAHWLSCFSNCQI